MQCEVHYKIRASSMRSGRKCEQQVVSFTFLTIFLDEARARVQQFDIPVSFLMNIYNLAAALARSARASRRLNLASWMTPASASLEKLPVHSTKVLFSFSPEVTG